MKLFLIVCYALSVLINGPTACAHAMEVAAAQQVQLNPAGHHAGHHDMRNAHSGDLGGDMGDDRTGDGADRHGCEEGCKGGPGCDGCVAATGLPGVFVDLASPAFAGEKKRLDIVGRYAGATGIEPPPPRA